MCLVGAPVIAESDAVKLLLLEAFCFYKCIKFVAGAPCVYKSIEFVAAF